MSRDDLIIIVLGLAGDKPLTPVQLQKAIFLLQNRCDPQLLRETYAFTPHHYGPFSQGIYRDAELLEGQDLLRIEQSPGNSYRRFHLTERGAEQFKALIASWPSEERDFALQLTKWVAAQSFSRLVSAIYREYPEYKVNSIFSED